MATLHPPVGIEVLVAAIKREALARGDTQPFHERTQFMLAGGWDAPEPEVAAHAPIRVTALREWLPFHGRTFLVSAYRTLLRREPDADGLECFALKIAQGRLTRWEVAGRLRLSSEGRARRVHVEGLWVGLVLATAYRVPVIGPVLGLVARIVCLPAYLQDHARDDRLIAQLLFNRP
jgi:hypothetical protein